MADNASLVGSQGLRQKTLNLIIVQVLVALFLSINIMLIATFCTKSVFYTTMRYILFAQTLISDCLILILSNVLLVNSLFSMPMQVLLCILMYFVSVECTFVTPLTLTMMTLERYVAICMPLRHTVLCSTRNALRTILIIHCLSVAPPMVAVLLFFTSATVSQLTHPQICTVEIFYLHDWHSHVLPAINELYFLIMLITIVFSYVKIMKVAKAASGENKTSSRKGLRTVLLHAFQLLLCLIQLWCPLIEAATFKVNITLYIIVRYFNYIMFYLTSRCLSPLIYGLRDEKFFLALKQLALRGCLKYKSFKLQT